MKDSKVNKIKIRKLCIFSGTLVFFSTVTGISIHNHKQETASIESTNSDISSDVDEVVLNKENKTYTYNIIRMDSVPTYDTYGEKIGVGEVPVYKNNDDFENTYIGIKVLPICDENGEYIGFREKLINNDEKDDNCILVAKRNVPVYSKTGESIIGIKEMPVYEDKSDINFIVTRTIEQITFFNEELNKIEYGKPNIPVYSFEDKNLSDLGVSIIGIRQPIIFNNDQGNQIKIESDETPIYGIRKKSDLETKFYESGYPIYDGKGKETKNVIALGNLSTCEFDLSINPIISGTEEQIDDETFKGMISKYTHYYR